MAATTPCPMHAAKNLTNIVTSAIVKAAGHHHHPGMMSMDGNSTDDDMMWMYFHGGMKDTILFDFWRPRSIGVFLLSCFILFVAAALYEGLKLLRERLIRAEIVRQASKEYQATSTSSKLLNRGHIIQTFLHMFQVTLSYLLMLVFMTYNTWLCLSVVLGAGVGYFFFGYKRLTTIDSNEHCH